MKVLAALCAAAMAVFTSALVHAQTRGSAPGLPGAIAADDNAVISGRVVDAVTRTPIDAALLHLISADSSTVYKAVSDSKGAFSFQAPAARYHLVAEKDGFASHTFGATRIGGLGATIDLTRAVHVNADMPLQARGVVTGRVVGADGEAAADLPVQLMRVGYAFGKQRMLPSAVPPVLTNDQGEYRLSGVIPDEYYVIVSPQSPLHVQAGFSAAPGNHERRSHIRTFYPGVADSSAAIPIAVTAGSEIVADLQLEEARTFSLRGQAVLRDGQHARTLLLTVFKIDAGGPMLMPVAVYTAESRDGRFEIHDIPSGSYEVMAQVSDPSSATAISRVDVVDADVDGVTVDFGTTVDLPVELQVTASTHASTDQEGAAGDDQLRDTHLVLRPKDNLMRGFPMVWNANTSSGRVANVSPGQYEVFVGNVPHGMFLQSIALGSLDALHGPVQIASGESSVLRIGFGRGGATVTVTVTDRSGTPRPGVLVSLVPEDPGMRRNLVRLSATDQNGLGVFDAEAPGVYYVFGWDDLDPAAAAEDRLFEAFRSRATRVTVGAAAVAVQIAPISGDDVRLFERAEGVTR